MESVSYGSILGSLIYLSTRTRLHIFTAVSMLGKFQSNPSMKDWKTLKHLLWYLEGTVEFEILVRKTTDKLGLMAWSDADWARGKSNGRSRSGFIIQFNGALIIWVSKLE